MKEQLKRIEKAIEIIESGKVWQHKDGGFRVFTERMTGAYSVSVDSCDCEDFEQRRASKDNGPCKHLWATTGAMAALLVNEIGKAQSLDALRIVGEKYADAIRKLPAAFVSVARLAYRARQDEIIEQSREDEKISILIKPQPKSNGNYYGVEI